MSACRVVGKLSSADAAYIAGLIDGEGIIALMRRHKQKSQLAEPARFIEAFFAMTANEKARRPLRNP